MSSRADVTISAAVRMDPAYALLRTFAASSRTRSTKVTNGQIILERLLDQRATGEALYDAVERHEADPQFRLCLDQCVGHATQKGSAALGANPADGSDGRRHIEIRLRQHHLPHRCRPTLFAELAVWIADVRGFKVELSAALRCRIQSAQPLTALLSPVFRSRWHRHSHVKVRAFIQADRVIRCYKFAEHCSTAHHPRSDGKIYSCASPKIIARHNPLIRRKRQQVAGNLRRSTFDWTGPRKRPIGGERCGHARIDLLGFDQKEAI